ncbi:hypothetical protein CDIK_1251 [Cucumispora dikerogammari]|nr:hypothetical protein CDIK_1251 [Cucumispora dikerogammari]
MLAITSTTLILLKIINSYKRESYPAKVIRNWYFDDYRCSDLFYNLSYCSFEQPFFLNVTLYFPPQSRDFRYIKDEIQLMKHSISSSSIEKLEVSEIVFKGDKDTHILYDFPRIHYFEQGQVYIRANSAICADRDYQNWEHCDSFEIDSTSIKEKTVAFRKRLDIEDDYKIRKSFFFLKITLTLQNTELSKTIDTIVFETNSFGFSVDEKGGLVLNKNLSLNEAVNKN